MIDHTVCENLPKMFSLTTGEEATFPSLSLNHQFHADIQQKGKFKENLKVLLP